MANNNNKSNKQMDMKSNYNNYQYYYNSSPYYNPQFNLDRYSSARFNPSFSFDSNPLSFFRDFPSFPGASSLSRDAPQKSPSDPRLLLDYPSQPLPTQQHSDDRASSSSSSSSFSHKQQQQTKKAPTISNYTPSPFLDNLSPFFNIPPFSPGKSTAAENFSPYFHYNIFPNKPVSNKSPNSKNNPKGMQGQYPTDAYTASKGDYTREQDKMMQNGCNQNPAHQHSIPFSPFFPSSDPYFMSPFHYPPNHRSHQPPSSSSSSSSEAVVNNFHSSYYQQHLNNNYNNNRTSHDFNPFFNQQSSSFPSLNPHHFSMHNI